MSPVLPEQNTDAWIWLTAHSTLLQWGAEQLIQVSAITVAAVFVIWQVRRQFSDAISQINTESKYDFSKKMFDDVHVAVRQMSQASAALSTRITSVAGTLELARRTREEARIALRPGATVYDINLLRRELSDAFINILSCIEILEIVDERIEIFKLAFNEVNWRMQNSMNSIVEFTHNYLPLGDEYTRPRTDAPALGNPNIDEISEFAKKSKEITRATHDFLSYTMDFQIEMANILLGGFLGKTLPHRSPLNSKYIVIRLDRFDSLKHHFNEETDWGREMKKLTAADILEQ